MKLQDDFPLASLPLLGYSVGNPSTEDEINKVKYSVDNPITEDEINKVMYSVQVQKMRLTWESTTLVI